jgi:hypothetical protein
VRVASKVLLALVLCAHSSTLAAEDADPKSIPIAPPGWLLPAPTVQLEMDKQLIPMGKGAIFVPAMSSVAAEPPYIVMDDGKVIERTPSGQKTILPPGRYTVLVGSGVESQMTRRAVEVFDDHATLVEPDWAGLVVHVVDQYGIQFRGTYEIFHLPTGEDFGLGLGADETRDEKLRTWLLPAGRYMVTRSGESVLARKDFITVQLMPGELTDLTLVQVREDGSFLGGGVVDRWEGKTELKNWRLGLIVGGDLIWNRNDNVAGRDFGNAVTLNAFINCQVRYIDPHHLIYARLQIDEGLSAQPGGSALRRELQKSIDEVLLDSIYTYRLRSWVGPYVRFGLDTNILPGRAIFDNPHGDVLIYDQNNNLLERRLRPDSLRLAESFDPLEFKEGAGISFDFTPSLIMDLHLRLGFGAREYLVRSLLIPQSGGVADDSNGCSANHCYVKAASSNLLGAEATFIGSARISRWLMIDTELDTLIPFTSSGPRADPVIDWRNTISLRLVSFASVAYVVRMEYNKQLSEHLQVEQRVQLRFTFDIL